MFDQTEIASAVDLSQRGYRLLVWLSDAVSRGFVSIDKAHSYASFPLAAGDWIKEHYENLPLDARPDLDALGSFCNLFTTYLEGSFELRAEPGQERYSPDAHCYCPMCSWLVNRRHLRPRKPAAKDKSRALKMLHTAVHGAAHDADVELSDDLVTQLLDDAQVQESAALSAYGSDLLRRLNGHSVGTAQLVLWRQFAWEPAGSPKKRFRLTAEMIINAEANLRTRVVEAGEASD